MQQAFQSRVHYKWDQTIHDTQNIKYADFSFSIFFLHKSVQGKVIIVISADIFYHAILYWKKM